MDHTFEITTELPLPRQVVFEFFSDAANLQRITPPELHFEILTSLPAPMGQGAWIEYQLRLFGVPFRWLTRISEWNPPHHFVDDQLRGPYARWIHRHTFESAAGGTTIRDSVRYGRIHGDRIWRDQTYTRSRRQLHMDAKIWIV